MTLCVSLVPPCLGISVAGPDGIQTARVDMRPCALTEPDERILQPALDQLNKVIATWGYPPVTCAQVRELA